MIGGLYSRDCSLVRTLSRENFWSEHLFWVLIRWHHLQVCPFLLNDIYFKVWWCFRFHKPIEGFPTWIVCLFSWYFLWNSRRCVLQSGLNWRRSGTLFLSFHLCWRPPRSCKEAGQRIQVESYLSPFLHFPLFLIYNRWINIYDCASMTTTINILNWGRKKKTLLFLDQISINSVFVVLTRKIKNIPGNRILSHQGR